MPIKHSLNSKWGAKKEKKAASAKTKRNATKKHIFLKTEVPQMPTAAFLCLSNKDSQIQQPNKKNTHASKKQPEIVSYF